MVCWMTEPPTLRARRQARDQAHDPLGPRRWSRTCTTGSTSTRCTATSDADDAGAQRDRPGQPAHHAAAVLRRVPPQPRRPAASSSSTRRTNDTVGAGMILGPTAVTVSRRPTRRQPERRLARRAVVGRDDAAAPRGATVWLTGLSGSGKSTVAVAVERLLRRRGPARLPARRRQPPPRPQRRPRLHRPPTATENVRRRRRGGPAVRRRRRRRPRAAHQPVPGRPRPRPGDPRGRRAARSSRCSSTRRSSCASSATRRASTPRPGPARSPASPASTTPTRRPTHPELVLTPEDGDPAEPRPRRSLALLAELWRCVPDAGLGGPGCVEPSSSQRMPTPGGTAQPARPLDLPRHGLADEVAERAGLVGCRR